MKRIGLKPIIRTENYLKYGFVKTECELYFCPKCNHPLNAGPNYQPNFCSNCGQRMDFSSVVWTKERDLGIDSGRFRDVDERQRKGAVYA